MLRRTLPAIDDVLRLIDDAKRARPGHRLVVAIDGPSGAGKTWLADGVSTNLAPGTALEVVHMEDLYPGWDGLEAGSRRLATDVLAPWRRSGSAQFKATTWGSPAPGLQRTVSPCEVLLVEGCGSGSLWGAAYVDLIVWCSGEALERRRAVANRGDANLERWWPQWAQQERAHLRRHRTAQRAHLCLATRQAMAPHRE